MEMSVYGNVIFYEKEQSDQVLFAILSASFVGQLQQLFRVSKFFHCLL